MSTEFEAAGGLSVFGALAVPGAADALADLVRDGVPGLLAQRDPTLWGDAAESEAKIRLGWVDTHRRSREFFPRLAELRDELRNKGINHVVLAGMGGSSLAPEVVSRTLDKQLTVLDTTDPHQLRAALGDRLEQTVVVISSKSGSTVETDSHRRAYAQAFAEAGMSEAEIGARFVVVTDPGSPLEAIGNELGATVFLADPDVGGRYSALTAFGLVPTALVGIDVAELIDQAEEFSASLALTEGNPALALGAALGAAALAGRDKAALVEDGTGIVGLGDWAEQLIAESTGKEGKGILPVVVETPTSPGAGPGWTEERSDEGSWGLAGPGARASEGERQQPSPGASGVDVLTLSVGGSLPPESVPAGGIAPHVAVNGPLGAQFLAWEYAVAAAGRVLGINPFDQPNVAESKENTSRILDSGLPAEQPAFVEGAIEVYGESIGHASTVDGALGMLLGRIEPGGYLAVMAFLDRVGDAAAAQVRPRLAQRTPRPVTFGWGPRFLHSTGQYHKGGPQNGSFLQVTGAVRDDLPVPGRPYTFGQLQAAQAAGDRQAITGRGRPLVRLHLTDRAAGVAQLLAALDSLPVVS